MSRPASGDPAGARAIRGGPLPAGEGEGSRRRVATRAHHQEEEEVSHLQVENQQVKQKARDQEEENSHLSAEIQRAQQHECDHLFTENQWLKEQVQVLKEQVSHLQVENQQVKQKARAQEEPNSHLLAEIQRAKQHECDHLFTENQWLKEQVQVLKEQVSHLQVENQQVKQKARDQEEQNSHLQDDDYLMAENQGLEQEMRVLTEVVSHFMSENHWLKHQVTEDISLAEEERQNHDQDTVSQLSAENHWLKKQVQALVDVASHRLEEHKKLMGQHRQEGLVSRLKREVQKVGRNQAAAGAQEAAKNRISLPLPAPFGISPGKVCRVQFQITGKTGGCEQTFLEEVSKCLSRQGVSLRVEETSTDLLLLVFCPIASQMSHDIENALEGLHGQQKVILVVMHYMQKDNTKTPWKAEEQGAHPALVQIVHTRYTLQEGFYLCEMNQRAMADVTAAIKDHAWGH